MKRPWQLCMKRPHRPASVLSSYGTRKRAEAMLADANRRLEAARQHPSWDHPYYGERRYFVRRRRDPA